ncbi:NAD+ synthetase [Haloterrigena turkmenica DSM 5511]|uniref:NH(3)-dependent NAD(+) synthetase n=1 Tax=Haloterrigena turkmenica (strain ATCC 51198 / DSM 5511 / JCM 9101 / NCIMB 13204 / VKM B-1734 / 4k) TaxID=543526 RepID=D2RQJ8_HALTV|nr:NAD+ synthase [Haloterrigena turkmenica]ADB62375.1 NAD+ synthetase [Haloterrigena turkmenica DSM 5511]
MGAERKTIVDAGIGCTTGTFITDRPGLELVRSRIIDDIRTTVEDAGATGVVVAMSGGIDSTATAELAVEALGSDRVLGLGLPCHKSERTGVSEARTIAEGLGIEFREIQLRPVLEAFKETAAIELESQDDGDDGRPDERNHAFGNVIARLRMCCAYYAANRQHRLVLGTANRSELLLGYFTKYGDGAADAYPLGDLYKTEVRALAKRIGVPRRIVSKEPSAGFWADQTDADELGATYDVIDPLLQRLVDEDESIEDAAATLEIDRETARSIAWLCAETEHKRSLPPTPGIADRGAEQPPARQ